MGAASHNADDNASVCSNVSSIFGGDSSAEIAELRARRSFLYSDHVRLQDEYNFVLAQPVDYQPAYTDEFDGFRSEWMKRLWMYIDAARTMYNEGRISIDHLKATAKSMPKLIKLSEKTPYFDSEGWESQVPCVDDILEMDSAIDMIGVASYPSPPKPNAPAIEKTNGQEEPDRFPTKSANALPESSPGVDVEAWLQQVN